MRTARTNCCSAPAATGELGAERGVEVQAELAGDRFTTLFDYGEFDRFATLEVIVLESGGGRLGHWLDRIDARVPRAVAGGRSWVTRCGRCSTSRRGPGGGPGLTATDPRPSSLRTPHCTDRCSPRHRLTEEEDE